MNGQWRAVLRRDANADGTFVYAVRSTGIYFRPSCPSRRPRRDRVLFFRTAVEAEVRGFRACRRCHPKSAADPWLDKIRRACALLESADEPPTLSVLAEKLGGSPYHLQRNFTRLV